MVGNAIDECTPIVSLDLTAGDEEESVRKDSVLYQKE